MTGGADADYFVFDSSLGAFGLDVIMDFENGVDKIDVRDVFSIANPANIADDFSDFTVDVSGAYGVRIRFEAGAPEVFLNQLVQLLDARLNDIGQRPTRQLARGAIVDASNIEHVIGVSQLGQGTTELALDVFGLTGRRA